MGFVGISRDCPLKTRPSKQPTEEISGYEIITSNPLKYPKSKQCLKWALAASTTDLGFGS
jgi:hypothetical protein